MDIFLTDQTKNFARLLAEYKTRPFSYRAIESLREAITSSRQKLHKRVASLKELQFDSLFQYQIFPDYILSFLTEWDLEHREMRLGDTILQQVYLPPLRKFSVKLVFGVRILEMFNSDQRIGFSYGTLVGHIEQGVSEFYARLLDGDLVFNIHTHSDPGNTLTKLFSPIVTRPYQAFVTRQALENMRRRFILEN